ncbi:hypothetical protein O181_006323 [Austropuccinia psidii MF-1]|uniref:Uncharacterized protein n=1 Tax=Austropuccinia psidii MF-1 TaxID=1389203 RepID=A0A9Q3BK14_9BASI|nr:hypothetical protein [Austropuccinia psidii MF-1]
MVSGTLKAPFGLNPRGPATNAKDQVGPKPQVDPPEQFFSKRTPRPKLAIFNPWPLATTRGRQIKLRKPFPHSGERLSFTNVLCTKDSRMVHILYNMPLCTNFAQQLNGDGFGTNIGGFPRLVDEVKEPSVDDAAIKVSGPENAWQILSYWVK